MDIKELLNITVNRQSSDLHLLCGYQPSVRVNGELSYMATAPVVSPSDMEQMLMSLLNSAQKEMLINNKELDFSHIFVAQNNMEVRFRVNIYFQNKTLAACFRLIPAKIPTIDDLKLPAIMHEFGKQKQGFVLMTGPTGSGKTTSLAAIVNEIAQERMVHVITIEDPIEYIYPKGRSIISQREIDQDTNSFTSALKSVLREDPDIVYVGEMRDYETVSAAMTIAETGHLVFSTLHTNSTSQTVDRIIDIFPPQAQSQARMQLSMVLSGIIAQRLVPAAGGGRLPVCEIMLGNMSIKNTIREGKTHMLDNIIQTSGSDGMILFEESLRQMVEQNLISPEIAIEHAIRPEMYMKLIER